MSMMVVTRLSSRHCYLKNGRSSLSLRCRTTSSPTNAVRNGRLSVFSATTFASRRKPFTALNTASNSSRIRFHSSTVKTASSDATTKGVKTSKVVGAESATGTGGGGAKSNERRRWKKVVFKAIKTLRIPFVAISVYGFGYQQGIIDFVRDPKKKERDMLTSVLSNYGVTNIEEQTTRMKASAVDQSSRARSSNSVFDGILRATRLSHDEDSHHRNLRRVATISNRLRRIALEKSHTKLEEAIQECMANYEASTINNVDATPEQLAKAYLLEQPEVQAWITAVERLDADDWDYVLIHSPVPNAFVTETFPRHIFVTQGLFDQYVTNDDELALVLAHEMSHLILSHNTETNNFEFALRALELLLLSLDPTDGLVFFVTVASLRSLWSRAFSRGHEREADELGVELAARACFDTRRAVKVFDRMHQLSGGDAAIRLGILNTHPSSAERYELLREASAVENATKYADSSCQHLKQTLRRQWMWQRSQSTETSSISANENSGNLATSTVVS